MGRELEIRTARLLLRSFRVMEKLGMKFDRADDREVVYRLRR